MPPEPRLAMLQRPPLPRSLVAALPALLASLAAAPIGAQASAAAGAVNALSDSGAARAPFFFSSAATVPAGTLGLSLHGAASRLTVRTAIAGFPMTSSRANALSTTASAIWGVTSFLTLTPYISASRVEQEWEHTPPATSLHPALRGQGEIEPGNLPTRQGTRTGLETDEFGLDARAALFRSSSGATRLGLTAVVLDRVDVAPSLVTGLALQHSLGRVTMHAAPALRLTQDDASRTLGLNGAAVVAATSRLGLSLEATHFRTWVRGHDDIDAVLASYLGGGVRFRFGRLAIDGGVRTLLEHDRMNADVDQYSLHLATHWGF